MPDRPCCKMPTSKNERSFEMRNRITAIFSGLAVMALLCWRWLQTLPQRGQVSADSAVAALEVSVESGPEALRERAPWRPSEVFAPQLSDGPAGAPLARSRDVPVGAARVGAVAGAVAGVVAGDGVGQLLLALRPASPSLLLGPGAVAAVRTGTAGLGWTPAVAGDLTVLTVTLGDHRFQNGRM